MSEYLDDSEEEIWFSDEFRTEEEAHANILVGIKKRIDDFPEFLTPLTQEGFYYFCNWYVGDMSFLLDHHEYRTEDTKFLHWILEALDMCHAERMNLRQIVKSGAKPDSRLIPGFRKGADA